jgi:uncharacterized protein (TIGR04255 family)
MAVQLGEPERAPLRYPPLGLVAFQVNFPEAERKLSSKEIFAFRDALHRGPERYGELTQIRRNQVTIQIGSLGPTTTEPSGALGWRLAVRDQSWSLSLFPDSVVLECRTYRGWSEDFRPRLLDAMTSTAAALKPEVETRLGLRYVNAFSSDDATSPAFWRDKIQPAFLGPIGDERLSPAFSSSGGRITFAFDDVEAVVATAFQPDAVLSGRTAAVFDIDVFRQGAREFSIASALEGADLLNTRALQIFQSIVAPSYLQELN